MRKQTGLEPQLSGWLSKLERQPRQIPSAQETGMGWDLCGWAAEPPSCQGARLALAEVEGVPLGMARSGGGEREVGLQGPGGSLAGSGSKAREAAAEPQFPSLRKGGRPWMEGRAGSR